MVFLCIEWRYRALNGDAGVANFVLDVVFFMASVRPEFWKAARHPRAMRKVVKTKGRQRQMQMMATTATPKWECGQTPSGAGKPLGMYPTSRVFWQKSLHLLDSKGVEFLGSDKEFARVWEVRSYGERNARARLSG